MSPQSNIPPKNKVAKKKSDLPLLIIMVIICAILTIALTIVAILGLNNFNKETETTAIAGPNDEILEIIKDELSTYEDDSIAIDEIYFDASDEYEEDMSGRLPATLSEYCTLHGTFSVDDQSWPVILNLHIVDGSIESAHYINGDNTNISFPLEVSNYDDGWLLTNESQNNFTMLLSVNDVGEYLIGFASQDGYPAMWASFELKQTIYLN